MTLKYKFDLPVEGIDVSKYQGSIDWPQVKAAGYTFALIRLGYANGDGTIVLDPYFDRNMRGAAAAGLEVGTYLYSYIDSEDHARLAAAKVLELVAEYTLTMPVVLDYEHGAKYKDYGRPRNTAICNAFLRTIAAGGYLPMYYSYKSFCDSYINLHDLEQYEGLWIANYTGKIGVDNAAIWQYSSSGRVPGIPGRCDLNRMYCDIPRIVRESYTPGTGLAFAPLTDALLEVYGGDKCEYFSAPSINATVPDGKGGTARLPDGTYPALALADRLVDGYGMVQVEYDGAVVYVALLDDRCRVVDKPVCDHEAELAALRAELDQARAERDEALAAQGKLIAKLDAVRAALEG